VPLKVKNNSPRVDLPIGIHLGDVVHSGHEVYGRGADLASRIENGNSRPGLNIGYTQGGTAE